MNQAARELDEVIANKASAPGGGEAAHRAAARRLRAHVGLMYPEEFWVDVRRLAAGDPDAVENALVFLEADPWCFRSGYAKEVLVRALRRHALSEPQRERLVAVLLAAVDVGERREFPLYCKLARRNATPALRDDLHRRLLEADPGSHGVPC